MAIVKKDGNAISFLNSEVKKEMAELVRAEVYVDHGTVQTGSTGIPG
jgi:hypothetical protein